MARQFLTGSTTYAKSHDKARIQHHFMKQAELMAEELGV